MAIYSTSFNVESRFPKRKILEKFPEVQNISFEPNGVFHKCIINADLPEGLALMLNFERLSEISQYAKSLINVTSINRIIPNEILEIARNSAKKFVAIGELANYIGRGGTIELTKDFRNGIITRINGTKEILKFSKPLTDRLVKGNIKKEELLKLQVTDIVNVDPNGEEYVIRRLVDFNEEGFSFHT